MAENEVKLPAKTLLVSACRTGRHSFTADAIEDGGEPAIPFEVAVSALDAALAQHPAIPEGTWRLLKKGEAIQSGDEVLADNCVEWGPLCGWERGMAYDPAAFVPVRRRIKEPDHG